MTIEWPHDFNERVRALGAVGLAGVLHVSTSAVYDQCRERRLLPLPRQPRKVRRKELQPRKGRQALEPTSRAAQRTHCINGHELVGDNLRLEVRGDGHQQRRCIACSSEKDRHWKQRQKERIEQLELELAAARLSGFDPNMAQTGTVDSTIGPVDTTRST